MTTKWLWSLKHDVEMYEESNSCCCLEDCALCGGGATPLNLVRRDRKRGGELVYDFFRHLIAPTPITKNVGYTGLVEVATV